MDLFFDTDFILLHIRRAWTTYKWTAIGRIKSFTSTAKIAIISRYDPKRTSISLVIRQTSPGQCEPVGLVRNSNHTYGAQEQQRRDAETDAKVARLQADLAHTSASEWDELRRRARAFIATAETTRDLTRTWIVVDMDMYAFVYLQDTYSNPP